MLSFMIQIKNQTNQLYFNLNLNTMATVYPQNCQDYNMVSIHQMRGLTNANSYFQRNKKILLALAIISIAIVIIVIPILYTSKQTFNVGGFGYQVYCPIDPLIDFNELQKRVNLTEFNYNKTINKTFIVWIKSYNITIDQAKNGKLFYCGYARNWYDKDCSNAKVVCSIPGPIFYFNVGQQANIIWINDINTEGIQFQKTDCYSQNSNSNMCKVRAKNIDSEKCSYDSTNSSLYSKNSYWIRLTENFRPISPHIHGLETYPTSDGNPLSWFTNQNEYGTGFIQQGKNQFYKQLFSNSNVIPSFNLTAKQLGSIKIVTTDHKQLSGMLFYHDHAMKATKINVARGLSGLYIIKNSSAQVQLPKDNEERIFVFSPAGVETLVLGYQVIYYLSGWEILNRNMTYRFRFLNAHFDSVYEDVSLVAYYKEIIHLDGTKQIIELNPNSVDFNLNDPSIKHEIRFTVIGTDTSIFHSPVQNVTKFSFASGERIDMLILLDSLTGVPETIKNIYLLCFDVPQNNYTIKFKFNLVQNNIQNKYKRPQQFIGIDVAFTNLSAFEPTKIVGQRMVGLYNYPREKIFLLNGHYMFENGGYFYPQIGTTQDWYITNNLWEGHPMHFHLINFQLINSYTLKTTTQGCTLYELDFFKNTRFVQFMNKKNPEICEYLQSLTDQQAANLYHRMDNYNIENIKELRNGKGFISGLDVMAQLNQNQTDIYSINGCSLNNKYKYICDNSFSQIPEHEKRWKDTVFVKKYSVYVLRIRWTRTDWQEADGYPYFNIPEEKLIEFPGFVYHCHILPHEDNQMMRPFMLQPSEYFKNMRKNLEGCYSSDWPSIIQCRNQQNKCFT